MSRRPPRLPPVRAEWLATAARPEQFPAPGAPEIAFLGRSNVGKSSLLNALVVLDAGDIAAGRKPR